MLPMGQVWRLLMLVIALYVPLVDLFILKTSFTFLKHTKVCVLSIALPKTIMFTLNFILIIS